MGKPIDKSLLFLSASTGYWHIDDLRRHVAWPYAMCGLPGRTSDSYTLRDPKPDISAFSICQDCIKIWNALPELPILEEPRKNGPLPDRTELLCEIADMLKPGLSYADVERAKALGLLVIALEVGLLREAVEKLSLQGHEV